MITDHSTMPAIVDTAALKWSGQDQVDESTKLLNFFPKMGCDLNWFFNYKNEISYFDKLQFIYVCMHLLFKDDCVLVLMILKLY